MEPGGISQLTTFLLCVPLTEFSLLKSSTHVGTCRKNKPDTPPELKLTCRPAETSMFAFTKDLTMVSYRPKKSRMVHRISSQHDDLVCTEDKNKPCMIQDYN